MLGLGQDEGPSLRWARSRTDPPARAGEGGLAPQGTGGVWSQWRGCMSPGQGHCHLAWVPHIAQHLGWAVGLEHWVLHILHHHLAGQWSQVSGHGG